MKEFLLTEIVNHVENFCNSHIIRSIVGPHTASKIRGCYVMAPVKIVLSLKLRQLMEEAVKRKNVNTLRGEVRMGNVLNAI